MDWGGAGRVASIMASVEGGSIYQQEMPARF